MENLVYQRGGSYSIMPSHRPVLILLAICSVALLGALLYIFTLRIVMLMFENVRGRAKIPIYQLLLILSIFVLCSVHMSGFREWFSSFVLGKCLEMPSLVRPYLSLCAHTWPATLVCAFLLLLILPRLLRCCQLGKGGFGAVFLVLLLNLASMAVALPGIAFLVLLLIGVFKALFGIVRQILAFAVILLYLSVSQVVTAVDRKGNEWFIWFS